MPLCTTATYIIIFCLSIKILNDLWQKKLSELQNDPPDDYYDDAYMLKVADG